MSKLIALRLPDDLAARVDADGSWTEVIVRILREHYSQTVTVRSPDTEPMVTVEKVDGHRTVTVAQEVAASLPRPSRAAVRPASQIPMPSRPVHAPNCQCWSCKPPKGSK